MTRIGTSIFLSKRQAYNYYADLGFSEKDVDRKIFEKEISISAKKPFKNAIIQDGRWFIVEEEENAK